METKGNRDGIEKSASEIVMHFIGFPSLGYHTFICNLIKKNIREKGIRTLIETKDP